MCLVWSTVSAYKSLKKYNYFITAIYDILNDNQNDIVHYTLILENFIWKI